MTAILKTVLQLMHPLGLIWLLLTAWLVLFFWRRRAGVPRRTALLPGLAWLILSVMTCTSFASRLMAGLEGECPQVTLADLPRADAVICMGGSAQPSFSEPTGMHLHGGADRLTTALAVAALGKAPRIILGGGGYRHSGRTLSEADAVVAHLNRGRATAAAVTSLGICADTHDEALKVAAVAREHGLKSFLLVTSASHMARSVAVFQKIGLTVTPVPCDYLSSFYHVGEDSIWPLHLPSAYAFEVYSAWIHEIIGSWVYRWRGWI